MTDYFDFFNQRIGKMMQRQAETFAAVTAPPCKNFSATPLDSATIDGSLYDTQTSTNVQGGLVPANLYSCNHWILDQSKADYFNASRGARPSPSAQAGDKFALLVWEIPYTRCNSSTNTKTYMMQKLIFNKQSDGSFRRNNSTASYYQPTLLGTLDSYYSAATLDAGNYAIQPNPNDPYAIRINSSQLNTMINANITALNTFLGSSPAVKSGYDDCFMVLSQPARWTSAPNSIVWTSDAADLATVGGGRPLQVTIAWQTYAVPRQTPTQGRYIARTNASRSVEVGTTFSITPDSAGNFNKTQLTNALENLKTQARNYIARQDQQQAREEAEFEEANTCPDGYRLTGGCGDNTYRQYGKSLPTGTCFRCVCRRLHFQYL